MDWNMESIGLIPMQDAEALEAEGGWFWIGVAAAFVYLGMVEHYAKLRR